MWLNIKSLSYWFWQVKVQEIQVYSPGCRSMSRLHLASREKVIMMMMGFMCFFGKGFIKGQAPHKLTGCDHVNMTVFKSTAVPFDGKLKILLRYSVITSCLLVQNLQDTALEFALID